MRKKRGRPQVGDKALRRPFQLRLPDDLLEEIEAEAAKRLSQPSRSAIIRELLEEALMARRRRTERKR